MAGKLTKLLLPALLLLAPAAALAAEPVLLVIDEYDNPLRFDTAVWRAVQLKKAGYDVRVLFESDGVLNFLPAGKAAGVFARKSSNDARAAHKANNGRHKKAYGGQKGRELLKELSRLGVPVTVCAFSAAVFGVEKDLKAEGASLSADPGSPVPLSSLAPDGARVLLF